MGGNWNRVCYTPWFLIVVHFSRGGIEGNGPSGRRRILLSPTDVFSLFSFPVRKEKNEKAVRFNALHLSFLPAGEHNAEIKA